MGSIIGSITGSGYQIRFCGPRYDPMFYVMDKQGMLTVAKAVIVRSPFNGQEKIYLHRMTKNPVYSFLCLVLAAEGIKHEEVDEISLMRKVYGARFMLSDNHQ